MRAPFLCCPAAPAPPGAPPSVGTRPLATFMASRAPLTAAASSPTASAASTSTRTPAVAMRRGAEIAGEK
ncbi:unnamed protein product [Closterium sp. NIES-54]